jgi:hypothetical protein
MLFGGLGVLKTVYDIFALFPRTSASVWGIFYLPVLSATAVLLLFTGFQLLVVGLVADAVLRRIAQYHPLIPSRAVTTSAASTSVHDVGASRGTAFPG